MLVYIFVIINIVVFMLFRKMYWVKNFIVFCFEGLGSMWMYKLKIFEVEICLELFGVFKVIIIML